MNGKYTSLNNAIIPQINVVFMCVCVCACPSNSFSLLGVQKCLGLNSEPLKRWSVRRVSSEMLCSAPLLGTAALTSMWCQTCGASGRHSVWDEMGEVTCHDRNVLGPQSFISLHRTHIHWAVDYKWGGVVHLKNKNMEKAWFSVQQGLNLKHVHMYVLSALSMLQPVTR